MGEHLNINNIENVVDPVAQKMLFDLSQQVRERDEEILQLSRRIRAVEEKFVELKREDPTSLAVYGNSITELPHGINKAIAECVVSTFSLC